MLYRPRLTDEQVLKIIPVLDEYLRNNTDDALEKLLDLFEEQSKKIAYQDWEAKRDLIEVEKEIDKDVARERDRAIRERAAIEFNRLLEERNRQNETTD